MPYLWLKALHVAAAITFVGGVLADAVLLPLLSDSGAASRDGQSLVCGLRDWHRLVTTPAMLVVWALGLALALRGGWFPSVWLSAKLVLVVALSAVHGVQSGALRRLAGGSALRLGRMRFGGAVIVGLVTAVAILVVVKPS
jgi:protoporphyrinogen IX oxidase